MLSLLISLLVLCVIVAIVWIILGKIPIPAEMRWIVEVVLLIVFAIAMLSILSGYWSFPIGHPLVR